MTQAVQLRKGTTSEHSTFTGLQAEATVDTTKKTIVVHDGSTAGGIPLSREDLSNANPSNLTTIVGADTASGDLFVVYDVSASAFKKITRAELNNAMEQDALASVAITGGSINGTTIGASTASTGAFTTLSASSTVTLSGGTANGVLYLNGSKVATSGSALTFDGTNLGVGTATPAAKLDLGTTVGKDVLLVYSGGSGSQYGLGISGGLLELYTSSSGSISFNQRNGASYSEQMRLTSTGLGIGTSSPSSKLQIYLTSNRNLQFTLDSGSNCLIRATADSGNLTLRQLGLDGSNIVFYSGATASTAGTEAMRLDSSGNLGLGVTPSAHGNSTVALQFPSYGVVAGGAGYNALSTGYNFYYNAGYKRIASGYATMYQSGGSTGIHTWHVAASGAADSAITFTQAMTLDASGNLTTGSSGSGVGQYIGINTNASSTGFFVYNDSAQTILSAAAAVPMIFRTNNTERARITSGGDVVVTGVGGLGYGTGSGGAVTQATSRTTGVTLDKTNGAITLVSAAGTTTWQTFTVTNNKVAATDTVIVNQKSGTDLYQIFVTNVAAGSFKISFATTGGTTTEQPVFNFAVIKAVTA